MVIKSKYSRKALFAYFLLSIPIAILYFVSYVIIDVNKENFFQFETVLGFLFLFWLPTIFLYSILQQYKVVILLSDRIIIKRFFGLLKQKYSLDEVKRTDYLFGMGHGILLQLRGSEQITLGAKEFENYYELMRAISKAVQADHSIKLRYFTKGLKILTGFGVVLLILLIINLAQ